MRTCGVRRLIAFITLIAFIGSTVLSDIAWAVEPKHFVHKGTKHQLGMARQEDKGGLEIDRLFIPKALGLIKERYDSGRESTIIHIQDAHCDYNAQKAIIEIISHFNANYNISQLGMEGAAGEYDLSPLTCINNIKTRTKVAEHFLKEGRINAPEYFAVHNPDKITLFGIEDRNLYLKNLRAYRESLKYKDSVNNGLAILSQSLNTLKEEIYSDDLKEFDTLYQSYKVEDIEFNKYAIRLNKLAGKGNLDISRYAAFSRLINTLTLEENIDFDRAEIEKNKLLELFGDLLSEIELKRIAEYTADHRFGNIEDTDYFRFIAKKAKEADVDLSKFPNLKLYLDYLSEYEALDKVKLFHEIAVVEDKIKDALCVTNDQKTLAKLSKNIIILKNLFNIRLRPADYKYYKEHSKDFRIKNFTSFIKENGSIDSNPTNSRPGLNPAYYMGKDLKLIDRALSQMESFYEIAYKRDHAFLNTIIARNRKNPSLRGWRSQPKQSGKPVILITGGFHTENLLALLKENHISYISIVPHFKKTEGENPYFKLLSGGKSALDGLIVRNLFTLALATFLQRSPLIGLQEDLYQRVELAVRAFKWAPTPEEGRANIDAAIASLQTHFTDYGNGKVEEAITFLESIRDGQTALTTNKFATKPDTEPTTSSKLGQGNIWLIGALVRTVSFGYLNYDPVIESIDKFDKGEIGFIKMLINIPFSPEVIESLIFMVPFVVPCAYPRLLLAVIGLIFTFFHITNIDDEVSMSRALFAPAMIVGITYYLVYPIMGFGAANLGSAYLMSIMIHATINHIVCVWNETEDAGKKFGKFGYGRLEIIGQHLPFYNPIAITIQEIYQDWKKKSVEGFAGTAENILNIIFSKYTFKILFSPEVIEGVLLAFIPFLTLPMKLMILGGFITLHVTNIEFEQKKETTILVPVLVTALCWWAMSKFNISSWGWAYAVAIFVHTCVNYFAMIWNEKQDTEFGKIPGYLKMGGITLGNLHDRCISSDSGNNVIVFNFNDDSQYKVTTMVINSTVVTSDETTRKLISDIEEDKFASSKIYVEKKTKDLNAIYTFNISLEDNLFYIVRMARNRSEYTVIDLYQVEITEGHLKSVKKEIIKDFVKALVAIILFTWGVLVMFGHVVRTYIVPAIRNIPIRLKALQKYLIYGPEMTHGHMPERRRFLATLAGGSAALLFPLDLNKEKEELRPKTPAPAPVVVQPEIIPDTQLIAARRGAIEALLDSYLSITKEDAPYNVPNCKRIFTKLFRTFVKSKTDIPKRDHYIISDYTDGQYKDRKDDILDQLAAHDRGSFFKYVHDRINMRAKKAGKKTISADYIQKVAKEMGVDPLLMIAIMFQETVDFDVAIVNPGDGHGLMGVNRTTAWGYLEQEKLVPVWLKGGYNDGSKAVKSNRRWLARKLLLDPNINIKVAARHLRWLWRYYISDIIRRSGLNWTQEDMIKAWMISYNRGQDKFRDMFFARLKELKAKNKNMKDFDLDRDMMSYFKAWIDREQIEREIYNGKRKDTKEKGSLARLVRCLRDMGVKLSEAQKKMLIPLIFPKNTDYYVSITSKYGVRAIKIFLQAEAKRRSTTVKRLSFDNTILPALRTYLGKAHQVKVKGKMQWEVMQIRKDSDIMEDYKTSTHYYLELFNTLTSTEDITAAIPALPQPKTAPVPQPQPTSPGPIGKFTVIGKPKWTYPNELEVKVRLLDTGKIETGKIETFTINVKRPDEGIATDRNIKDGLRRLVNRIKDKDEGLKVDEAINEREIRDNILRRLTKIIDIPNNTPEQGIYAITNVRGPPGYIFEGLGLPNLILLDDEIINLLGTEHQDILKAALIHEGGESLNLTHEFLRGSGKKKRAASRSYDNGFVARMLGNPAQDKLTEWLISRKRFSSYSYEDLKKTKSFLTILHNILIRLVHDSVLVRENSARILKDLIEIDLVTIEEVRSKITGMKIDILEKDLTGFMDVNFQPREDSSKVLKVLMETGLATTEEIRHKIAEMGIGLPLDTIIWVTGRLTEVDRDFPVAEIEIDILQKTLLGFMDENIIVQRNSSKTLKRLIETGVATTDDVRPLGRERIEWLHENIKEPGLDNERRTFIYENLFLQQGYIAPGDIGNFTKLIKADDREESVGFMLNTMCYFSVNGSDNAQRALDGMIDRILSRRPKKGKGEQYIPITKKDEWIIWAMPNSYSQEALRPFVYREDIPPDIRISIIGFLAEADILDNEYKAIPHERQEQYLAIISKTHDQLNRIPPFALVVMIDSGEATVDVIKENIPEVEAMERQGDYHTLVERVATDKQFAITYYCLRQAPFNYPGTGPISFDRFKDIIEKAKESLESEDRDVVTVTLKDAFVKAGLSDEEAAHITGPIIKGKAPLPGDSGYLNDNGGFVPQEIDIALGAKRSEPALKAGESFNASLRAFIDIIEARPGYKHEHLVARAIKGDKRHMALFTGKEEETQDPITLNSLNIASLSRIENRKKAQKALRAFLVAVAIRAGITDEDPQYTETDEMIGDIVGSLKNYTDIIDEKRPESSVREAVWLDYVDKNNLFEALRFSDGAHCCNSSDPKVNRIFGGGIYDNNAHRWLADATTFFFQVSTEPRGGKQIGWLKCWFGIDEDGLPFVGSNYLYLAPSYQDLTLQEAILDKIEEVLSSVKLKLYQTDYGVGLPANALRPPVEYEKVTLDSITRLQSLKDDQAIQADVKFHGNIPITQRFFVKTQPTPMAEQPTSGPMGKFKVGNVIWPDTYPEAVGVPFEVRVEVTTLDDKPLENFVLTVNKLIDQRRQAISDIAQGFRDLPVSEGDKGTKRLILDRLTKITSTPDGIRDQGVFAITSVRGPPGYIFEGLSLTNAILLDSELLNFTNTPQEPILQAALLHEAGESAGISHTALRGAGKEKRRKTKEYDHGFVARILNDDAQDSLTDLLEIKRSINMLPVAKVDYIYKSPNRNVYEVFIKTYSYLKKKFNINTTDKKRRKRLFDVSYQIAEIKDPQKAFRKALKVIEYLEKNLGFNLPTLKYGTKSKLMTIVYGVTRIKDDGLKQWTDFLGRIKSRFEIDSLAELPVIQRQKTATAAYYIARGKEKNEMIFNDVIEVIQTTFDIKDLTSLTMDEKIRLITAAYEVALAKDGLTRFKANISIYLPQQVSRMSMLEKLNAIVTAYKPLVAQQPPRGPMGKLKVGNVIWPETYPEAVGDPFEVRVEATTLDNEPLDDFVLRVTKVTGGQKRAISRAVEEIVALPTQGGYRDIKSLILNKLTQLISKPDKAQNEGIFAIHDVRGPPGYIFEGLGQSNAIFLPRDLLFPTPKDIKVFGEETMNTIRKAALLHEAGESIGISHTLLRGIGKKARGKRSWSDLSPEERGFVGRILGRDGQEGLTEWLKTRREVILRENCAKIGKIWFLPRTWPGGAQVITEEDLPLEDDDIIIRADHLALTTGCFVNAKYGNATIAIILTLQKLREDLGREEFNKLTILDAGAGRNAILGIVAARLGAGQVVSVEDNSQEEFEAYHGKVSYAQRARENIEAQNLNNITFIEGDMNKPETLGETAKDIDIVLLNSNIDGIRRAAVMAGLLKNAKYALLGGYNRKANEDDSEIYARMKLVTTKFQDALDSAVRDSGSEIVYLPDMGREYNGWPVYAYGAQPLSTPGVGSETALPAKIAGLPVTWGPVEGELRVACIQMEYDIPDFARNARRIEAIVNGLSSLGEGAPDLVVFPEMYVNTATEGAFQKVTDTVERLSRTEEMAIGYSYRGPITSGIYYRVIESGEEKVKLLKSSNSPLSPKRVFSTKGDCKVAFYICDESEELSVYKGPYLPEYFEDIDLMLVPSVMSSKSISKTASAIYQRLGMPAAIVNSRYFSRVEQELIAGSTLVYSDNPKEKITLSDDKEEILIFNVPRRERVERTKIEFKPWLRSMIEEDCVEDTLQAIRPSEPKHILLPIDERVFPAIGAIEMGGEPCDLDQLKAKVRDVLNMERIERRFRRREKPIDVNIHFYYDTNDLKSLFSELLEPSLQDNVVLYRTDDRTVGNYEHRARVINIVMPCGKDRYEPIVVPVVPAVLKALLLLEIDRGARPEDVDGYYGQIMDRMIELEKRIWGVEELGEDHELIAMRRNPWEANTLFTQRGLNSYWPPVNRLVEGLDDVIRGEKRLTEAL